MENPLTKVLSICEGPAELARRIGKISSQAISQWEFIPESRALDVEGAVQGKVTCREILEYAKRHRRSKEAAA